jgi:peptidoglycan/LPS O-acetylase OafA/YrhL
MRIFLALSGMVFFLSAGHFVLNQFFLYPLATVGCLLFFLSIYGIDLSFRPLVYFGKISYGLYVYHMLALTVIAQALGGHSGTAVRFLAYWFGSLALTMILAMLSYRFLESPFLRLKQRFEVIRSRPV